MGWITLTLYINIYYILTRGIERIQNYFLPNLSLSFFLSFSSLLHVLAARNPRISWPPTQKGKKGGARNQHPPYTHPPFVHPLLDAQEEYYIPSFIFFEALSRVLLGPKRWVSDLVEKEFKL